ncbi:MAG: S9 family peptidase [Terriglobales bacterium]
MLKSLLPTAAIALTSVALAQAPVKQRPLRVDDLSAIQAVADARCSPDGRWVAYTVSTVDVKADRRHTHVWMAPYAGGANVQMTSSEASESSPRWSPDGKYLSFLSSRPGAAKGSQVWLLPRQGGEARQLTAVEGSLHGYAWSPDSQRLALLIEDPDPVAVAAREHPGAPQFPHPIVIDRYRFEQDNVGYITTRYTHLYVFDLATRKLTQLTKGARNESNPAWSPDGAHIAFFSNHDSDPDRDTNGQVYVVDVRPGAVARQLTPEKFYAAGRPAWSRDGKNIAFLQGTESRLASYDMHRLAIVSADGSTPPRRVSTTLDRGVSDPKFSPDGRSVTVIVEDDRSTYPARIALATGAVTKLAQPPITVSSYTTAAGCTAAIVGGDQHANEVYALGGSAPRALSHHNDALFKQLELGKVSDVSFTASDGNVAHGLLTLPVGDRSARRVPFLLRIHGGPNAQNNHSFNFENQILAANGYAVLNVNYRGSAGRGFAYSSAIAADWGDLEVKDLEAGVNWALQQGIADPARLGVGGWSYGCILTDYMIASDPRLKAATCGAGTGFTVALYGVDEYVTQYDNEIGPPWNPAAWAIYQKISYPFLHADRIKTPTLYLDGTQDMNVPMVGNKQMYEALKSLGVPTELVLYPGEWHDIGRPSFQRDRYRRYLGWYAKYLK